MFKVHHVQKNVRNIARVFSLLVAALLFAGISIMPANAEVIERIDINQVADEAEIKIQFITRIQFLRQAQLENGEIRIYFNLLNIDPLDLRLVAETKKSPQSDIAPAFTITYPEPDSALTIRGDNIKMWNYHIHPGNDGRSISVFVSLFTQNKSLPKPAVAAGAAPSAIAPPAQTVPAPVPPANIPSVKVVQPAITGKVAKPPEPELASEVAQQPEPAGAPPASQHTAEEIEQQAKRLIGSARFALDDNRIETAIGTLNRLLGLPPNQQSQPAQKMIGEAREKRGETAKARAEYELYLKLYPNAADADEIKARLASLPAQAAQQEAPRAARKFVADDKMLVSGNISQNYYRGESRTRSTTWPVVTSFSLLDQSMLISSLDMLGRIRSETIDTRIVLRDSHRADFLPGKADRNRLNAAYFEQGARDKSYLYRLGRQTGYSGGVPGRFDGAVAGYSLNPTWRINGVIGAPVEFIGNPEHKTFAGLSVDLTRRPGEWGGSSYLIEQRVGRIADRRAIGLETRYFDEKRNYLGQLEYDELFRKINVGMFQGNWTTESGANYFLLADHRKSPSLQLTNALPGQAVPTIAGLLRSGVALDTLYADAQALSATSDSLMIGMNRPYLSNLRVGGDFRVTNMSGTGASSTQPASPGTGDIYTYSLQALGSNLFFENDFGVMSGSFTDARTYKGMALSFSQVENFLQRWRLDMSLQLYRQHDIFGNHQERVTPSFKLNYRLSDSVNLEGEAGVDYTHNSNATMDDRILRQYFFFGYRWDF